MKYVVYRPFKGTAIYGGDFDLPVMTICESTKGYIHDNNKIYCYDHSENAHKYFARNDDGLGMKRGNLIQNITSKLSNKTSPSYQELWDKIWNDERCQKFKRPEHNDYWLWNHDFYNAEIEDLEYIWNLIS